MATIILSTAATALTDAIGVGSISLLGSLTVGAAAGAFGALAGGLIDNLLFAPNQRVRGQRLSEIPIMTASEGTPIPLVYGRSRVAGHVLHATRFKENSTTRRASKNSPTTTTYSYSISLAIAICEGPLTRLSAVYADNKPLDLSAVMHRIYMGTPDQPPDILLQQLYGADNVPAYRDLAYIVLEDLPLAAYGNRIPQLSFDVLRMVPDPDSIAPLVHGVCLIPGSGEFALSDTPITRTDATAVYENRHYGNLNSDIRTSLDDLQAIAPNLQRTGLVVCQFASDLRAGQCRITPRVETRTKRTHPHTWYSAGYTRATAPTVSLYNNAPAYGGTPSDQSILEAIALLKQRGLLVVYYPFLMCDIAPNNPMGQPAYPWRGRITAQSPADIAAFFGSAQGSDFSWHHGQLRYNGNPLDQGYRRMILHHAHLCAMAGGVDVFVIGSELIGLTHYCVNRQYPAVDALVQLAADVRTILPQAKLTYGADWSEDGSHSPPQTNDLLWPLDPLWATLDYIGLDWYAPLTDTRDNAFDTDATPYSTPHAFLQSRITGGEGYDWYYATPADRATQTRTPITDGAYQEPWVYKTKALVERWSNPHYNRYNGVRQSTPTAWQPQSKPLFFLELGCGAIDKGGNAPNLFFDAKSSENAAPPFSIGTPNPLIQQQVLRAYLTYYATIGNHNPVSGVYGAPMLSPHNILLWCWDTRPFPAYPALSRVWRDASNWLTGHWLNGRLEGVSATALLRALCARIGMPCSFKSPLSSMVYGYALSEHATAAQALAPLVQFFGADVLEQAGGLCITSRDSPVVAHYTPSDMLLPTDNTPPLQRQRADSARLPNGALLTYADIATQQPRATAAVGQVFNSHSIVTLDTPLLTDWGTAQQAAQRLYWHSVWQSDTIRFSLPPSIKHDPADVISVDCGFGAELFRITQIGAHQSGVEITATRTEPHLFTPQQATLPDAGDLQRAPALPEVFWYDLPLLRDADPAPLLAIAARNTPWTGLLNVYNTDATTLLTSIGTSVTQGTTLNDLWRGPTSRIDPSGALWVQFAHGSSPLSSCTYNQLLAGSNTALLWHNDTATGEVIQFQYAQLVYPSQYKLSGLLRGQRGTEHLQQQPWPTGSTFTLLDNALVALPALETAQSVRVGSAAANPLSEAYQTVEPHSTGRALVPLSPVHLRLSYPSNGDWLLQWIRRSRIGGDDFDAPDIPLGEPFEQYRVSIYRADNVLLAQYVVTTPFYAYPYAERAAHGHSAAYFSVAQCSRFTSAASVLWCG